MMGCTMMKRASYAFMCAALLTASAAGCSSTHQRASNNEGGETHFMRSCLSSGACEDGLSCVCGVCTKTCENDSACTALGEDAACNELEPDSLVCGSQTPSSQICDTTCMLDMQCQGLGSGYECIDGRCRPSEIATALASTIEDAGMIEDAGPVSVDSSVEESMARG